MFFLEIFWKNYLVMEKQVNHGGRITKRPSTTLNRQQRRKNLQWGKGSVPWEKRSYESRFFPIAPVQLNFVIKSWSNIINNSSKEAPTIHFKSAPVEIPLVAKEVPSVYYFGDVRKVSLDNLIEKVRESHDIMQPIVPSISLPREITHYEVPEGENSMPIKKFRRIDAKDARSLYRKFAAQEIEYGLVQESDEAVGDGISDGVDLSCKMDDL